LWTFTGRRFYAGRKWRLSDLLRLTMQYWRSSLNLRFRSLAKAFRPSNPVRRLAAGLWAGMLRLTGPYLELPLQGESVRLLSKFRSWNLEYESEALGTYLRVIQPGDTVWDVGANIGIYTLLAGKRTGAAGQVTAWEPNPVSYRILAEHLRANGLKGRCRALQAAVHDGSTPTVRFRLEVETSSSRIGSEASRSSGPLVTVPAKSLDQWRTEVGRHPRVLKVDVEGAEVLVLQGGRKLLTGELGARPFVLVAVHPQFLGEFGSTSGDIDHLCHEFGYLCFDLHGKPARPVDYSEYWLVPPESRERFLGMLAPSRVTGRTP
jgi:FkbM family methyltransferase